MNELTDDLADWVACLPLVQRTLNCTPCAATGNIPPANIMFGNLTDTDRVLLHNPVEGVGDVALYYDNLLEAQRQLVKAVPVPKPRPVTQTTFTVGQAVVVTRPDNARGPSRLSPIYMGPYTVASLDGTLATLTNLRTRAEETYDLRRLVPFLGDYTPDDLTAFAAAGEQEYTVEDIIDHRSGRTKTRFRFRVRWAGYGPDDDTWLPYAEVRDLEALDRYFSLQGQTKHKLLDDAVDIFRAVVAEDVGRKAVPAEHAVPERIGGWLGAIGRGCYQLGPPREEVCHDEDVALLTRLDASPFVQTELDKADAVLCQLSFPPDSQPVKDALRAALEDEETRVKFMTHVLGGRLEGDPLPVTVTSNLYLFVTADNGPKLHVPRLTDVSEMLAAVLYAVDATNPVFQRQARNWALGRS
ncbi:Chromo (CHRromatin Organization MOdifier) domain [Carpediemonas membranifera]|uniref:Chromo (CHRromatin Organization MOdifier) domain n=1 Tax=Carpediemonas membranifera TaxID=201153 RepID=A0A8J6B7W1_9EUKA|nr:Chromo (CHRromatin Organization MOdifier) domain [Carpediemonas membranifera]|eukprot:KAG9394562.1 Chromo (CHRromatin Organization MOdifier) domain [Carpediemonas membranifera]